MYFITCLENLELDALGWLGESRCFGYFSTYQRAKEALEINECDMWEAGFYNYAVIERIEREFIHTLRKWRGLNLIPKNEDSMKSPNRKRQKESTTTHLDESDI